MPNLSDLRTEIENLDDDLKRAYVLERSKVNTDKDGYTNAGFSKATFYKWPTEDRDYLNKLSQRIRTEVSLQIMMRLQEAGLEAVDVKIGGLKTRNESIRQKSSTEILEWLIGKPTQKVDAKTEVTGAGGAPLIDNDRYDRAISGLADAIREIVPGKGTESDGAVGSSE